MMADNNENKLKKVTASMSVEEVTEMIGTILTDRDIMQKGMGDYYEKPEFQKILAKSRDEQASIEREVRNEMNLAHWKPVSKSQEGDFKKRVQKKHEELI